MLAFEKLAQKKVDGALGAMIIEDQPTHSIYTVNLAQDGSKINDIRLIRNNV